MSYQSRIRPQTKHNDSINHSHLGRTVKRIDSDVQKFSRQIKKIKYPVHAIQPAQQLSTKISYFKNQKVSNQMKKKLMEQNQLNSYRKIRGDGNCFFRALAYSYISNIKNINNVSQVFSQLNQIELTVCSPQSIPKQFKPFYNDKILKQIICTNWQFDIKYFQLSCKNNKKRILSRLFRKYPYLDFIVILYFRSLCLSGFLKYKQSKEFTQFMKGSQEEEITTYGEESQGLILDICSRALKVSIEVFEVRKQQLKHYSYKQLKPDVSINLLFYQNHYDLLEKITLQSLEQQKQDNNLVQQDFYSEVQSTMIQGECIQCGRKGDVYQQNFLCYRCFEISKNQFINAIKSDKFITGTCVHCGRKNQKILQMLKMCQKCKDRQQEEIEKQKNEQKNRKQMESENSKKSPQKNVNSPSKKTKTYCKKCKQQLRQNQSCQNCAYQIGKCINCNLPRRIKPQTGICTQCAQYQQYYLTNYKKANCEECGKFDTIQLASGLCWNCKNRLLEYQKNKRFKIEKDIQQQKRNEKQSERYNASLKQRFQRKDQICKLCYQALSSQFHHAKCQKGLTKAKFENRQFKPYKGPKQSYSQNICTKCKQLKLNQKIVDGICNSCYKESQRIKTQIFQRQRKKEGIKLGQKMANQSQRCRYCNRPVYVHKLQNGYCESCKPSIKTSVYRK